MAIKINTRQVTATASSIKTLNTKINTDFSEMEQSIKRLNSYWDGTASKYPGYIEGDFAAADIDIIDLSSYEKGKEILSNNYNIEF